VSPWQLSNEKQESISSRRFRDGLAALFLAAGIISLFLSPIAWQLVVVYTCLGLVAGLLTDLGQIGGLAGLLIIFLVAGTPTFLPRFGSEWNQAWWQPGVIVLAGLAIEHLTPLIIRNLRQRL
jgi:hypothetical protein